MLCSCGQEIRVSDQFIGSSSESSLKMLAMQVGLTVEAPKEVVIDKWLEDNLR